MSSLWQSPEVFICFIFLITIFGNSASYFLAYLFERYLDANKNGSR